MYKQIMKPVFDITLSFFGLIALSPVFLVLTLILAIQNKGNVFFLPERAGFQGKPFRVIKFRTMNEKKDDAGNLLPPGERITKTGRIIRATSLDEIPQLINILKGDMSLIGPRPLHTYYLPLYNETQQRRHNVKPGITGWAQVNGRNTISWQQKFEYDVWYVDNLSFRLDIKILFLTLLKVLRREGISQTGHATMEIFRGNE